METTNEKIVERIDAQFISTFTKLSCDTSKTPHVYLINLETDAYDFDSLAREIKGKNVGCTADALYLANNYHNFVEFKNARIQNTRTINSKQFKVIKNKINEFCLTSKQKEELLEAILPQECTIFDEIKLKAIESTYILHIDLLDGQKYKYNNQNRFILVFNKKLNFEDGELGASWSLEYEMQKAYKIPSIFSSLDRLKVYYSDIYTVHEEDFCKIIGTV